MEQSSTVKLLEAENELLKAKLSLQQRKPLVINGRAVLLVQIQELSSALGVSPSTIRNLVADGLLPAPIEPTVERKAKGRKVQLWDLYECLPQLLAYREGNKHWLTKTAD